jgi:hypothetical protein
MNEKRIRRAVRNHLCAALRSEAATGPGGSENIFKDVFEDLATMAELDVAYDEINTIISEIKEK